MDLNQNIFFVILIILLLGKVKWGKALLRNLKMSILKEMFTFKPDIKLSINKSRNKPDRKLSIN